VCIKIGTFFFKTGVFVQALFMTVSSILENREHFMQHCYTIFIKLLILDYNFDILYLQFNVIRLSVDEEVQRLYALSRCNGTIHKGITLLNY